MVDVVPSPKSQVQLAAFLVAFSKDTRRPVAPQSKDTRGGFCVGAGVGLGVDTGAGLAVGDGVDGGVERGLGVGGGV